MLLSLQVFLMNLSGVDGSADEREKDPQVLASGDVMESQPTINEDE